MWFWRILSFLYFDTVIKVCSNLCIWSQVYWYEFFNFGSVSATPRNKASHARSRLLWCYLICKNHCLHQTDFISRDKTRPSCWSFAAVVCDAKIYPTGTCIIDAVFYRNRCIAAAYVCAKCEKKKTEKASLWRINTKNATAWLILFTRRLHNKVPKSLILRGKCYSQMINHAIWFNSTGLGTQSRGINKSFLYHT